MMLGKTGKTIKLTTAEWASLKLKLVSVHRFLLDDDKSFLKLCREMFTTLHRGLLWSALSVTVIVTLSTSFFFLLLLGIIHWYLCCCFTENKDNVLCCVVLFLVVIFILCILLWNTTAVLNHIWIMFISFHSLCCISYVMVQWLSPSCKFNHSSIFYHSLLEPVPDVVRQKP